MIFFVFVKFFKFTYIFNSLSKIFFKQLHKHLTWYLILIKILNFCLLFDIAHLLDPILFFVIVLVLILTTPAIFIDNKLIKYTTTFFINFLAKLFSFLLNSFKNVINVIFLIDYFLFVTSRFLKYILIAFFIICKHFLLLFLILFTLHCTYINIFYIHSSTYNIDYKKTNKTFSQTSTARDVSKYGQKETIAVSVTPENTESIFLRSYLVLAIISFCIRIFCKNKILCLTKLFFLIFVIFICIYFD